jgi:hypothetical protein
MRTQSIDVRARSEADPGIIFELLTATESWPAWTPFDASHREQEGESGGDSLGSIRVLRSGPVRTREQVIELVPGRRFSYTMLSGMPLRGYRADVDLEPAGPGTAIRWHATFTTKIPGTGWFFRRVLTGYIRRCAKGLAAHAEALARASG